MYQLLHFHPNGRWPRLQPAVVVGWSLYYLHRHVTRSNDYFDANYIIASQPIQLVLSVYSPPTVQMSDISDANAENRNSYLIFGISHSLNRLSRWGGTQLLSSPRNPGGEEEARRLKWCYWGQSTNETLCPFPFTFRWPNYQALFRTNRRVPGTYSECRTSCQLLLLWPPLTWRLSCVVQMMDTNVEEITMAKA